MKVLYNVLFLSNIKNSDAIEVSFVSKRPELFLQIHSKYINC